MPQRHRPELSESVAAEPLSTYRRTARAFSSGRRCVEPGCLTVLSIYNGGKHCAAHNPKQVRVTRPRMSCDQASNPQSVEGGHAPARTEEIASSEVRRLVAPEV